MDNTAEQTPLELESKRYSEGWGENNDEKSFIAGAKWQAKQSNQLDLSEPIQNALYATGKFTTDQCEQLTEGIIIYINDHQRNKSVD